MVCANQRMLRKWDPPVIFILYGENMVLNLLKETI